MNLRLFPRKSRAISQWPGCSTCCGEGPARALSRHACECAVAHERSRHERCALSRVVHRVLGFLDRVVRLHLVHCHLSAHVTMNGGGAWHVQRVSDACAARAAEVASAFAARVRAICASSAPADALQMASDASTPSMHFESTSVAGRTRVRRRTRVRQRTHAACASSVLCTRVLVCKAQSREKARRQGSRQKTRCAHYRMHKFW